MAPNGVRLKNIEQLARAGPDEFDLRMVGEDVARPGRRASRWDRRGSTEPGRRRRCRDGKSPRRRMDLDGPDLEDPDPDGFHDCMDDPAMMDELFYESDGERLVVPTGALPWGAVVRLGRPAGPGPAGLAPRQNRPTKPPLFLHLRQLGGGFSKDMG